MSISNQTRGNVELAYPVRGSGEEEENFVAEGPRLTSEILLFVFNMGIRSHNGKSRVAILKPCEKKSAGT